LPGNHEKADNFSHSDSRFSMLGDYLNPQPNKPFHERINNHFHRENVGAIHIVSFSTEFYYDLDWGRDHIQHHQAWLVMDLKRANQNRKLQPWIAVLGHRSRYCLRIGDTGSCKHDTIERPSIRIGVHWENDEKLELQYGLEKLFYDEGVDIQIYAHEHYYARLHPLYDHKL